MGKPGKALNGPGGSDTRVGTKTIDSKVMKVSIFMMLQSVDSFVLAQIGCTIISAILNGCWRNCPLVSPTTVFTS